MKKTTGIVRKIDNLGRVVVPMEMRKVNNWVEGTPLEFSVEGESVLLKKYEDDYQKKVDENLLRIVSNHIDDSDLKDALNEMINRFKS